MSCSRSSGIVCTPRAAWYWISMFLSCDGSIRRTTSTRLGIETSFRLSRIAAHHNIDQPVRHVDHPHDVAALDVRADAVAREGAGAGGGFVGAGGEEDAVAEFAVDLHGDLHLLERGERCVVRRPLLVVHAVVAA